MSTRPIRLPGESDASFKAVTDRYITELEATVEQLKLDYELKSVVHRCCSEVVKLEAELERTRDLCVALESHIADSSLARFHHENVDRFIPEPGYPNGIDSEIDVASPFYIHPEGVPQ